MLGYCRFCLFNAFFCTFVCRLFLVGMLVFLLFALWEMVRFLFSCLYVWMVGWSLFLL